MHNIWRGKEILTALAPMADYTDSPFCRICREVASKSFIAFREMVSSEAITRENEKTFKMCEFNEIERPIVIQIFGAEPKNIAEAANAICEKYKPDGIDINMGCPVPKISGKVLAGAALMKNYDKAVEIVRMLKKNKLSVPVSVKTRLGWSKEDEILTFAPKLEEAGADAITIHGRTKIQGYAGQANWKMIGEVKKIISIPVIANGDIKSAEDIKKCLEITDADGVMIGRGALGNPWIFKNEDCEITNKELVDTVLRHARLHLERYGERGMVTFRKHLAWYFKGDRIAGIKNAKKLKAELMKINSIEELKNILQTQIQ